MSLHFFRRTCSPVAVIITLNILAGCGTQYVEGLVLTVDDSIVSVSRLDSGKGASVVAGTVARFAFTRPIDSGYQRDFAVYTQGSGELTVQLFSSRKDKNPVASANFRLIEGKSGELRLAIPDGASIARAELGFNEAGNAIITAFGVVPAFIGARFGSTSYVISSGTGYASSSAASDATRAPREISVALPIKPDSSLSIKLDADGIAKISVLEQNGVARLAFTASVRSGVAVSIPLSAFQGAQLQMPGRVSVESEDGLTSVWIAPGGAAPLADLHAILAVTVPLDGDYSLYRWDLLPETLVFDFADYAIQDSYFKRLAFFAEKPGFRGRLALDEEIEALHGWNAHDYSSGTLVSFFSIAQTSNFKLNEDEKALLELLVSHGILTRDSRGVIGEGSGAIISVSRESSAGLRRMFMDHESSHALFFQDAEYRKISAELWALLGPEARRFWMQHLAWRRYDTRDEYLRVNEMQAYLVQQSVSSVKAYYEALIERLAVAYPDDRARLEADSVFVLDSAVTGSQILDSYLRKRWGLSAGRFGRVRKF